MEYKLKQKYHCCHLQKNKHYVYFLFGGRVSAYLRCCTDREASLTKILNNAPEEHIQLVDKMQKTLKISKRSNSSFQKEVAKYEATAIKDAQPPQKFSFIHRKDGDMDYINTFLTEIGEKVSILLDFLSLYVFSPRTFWS